MTKFYLTTRFLLRVFILFLNVHVFNALAMGKTDLLIKAAKDQVGKTIRYNPKYQKITFPLGDVPIEEGVCTDVIIRAFRELELDLQKLVHEDMKKNWNVYPKKWGLKKTDSNIDHRRVPNLMTYFQRKNMVVRDGKFKPGDIVVWDLGGGILHIGLLSNQTTKSIFEERPLVFHNIAHGVQEEDILRSFKIVGHYRYMTENNV